MLKESSNRSWMLISRDLCKDAPFFTMLGVFSALIQVWGHRYAGSNWGSELLVEHIPFNSLILLILFLFIARFLTKGVYAKREMPRMKALINHVSQRAVVFASVSASTMAGFTLTAAFFQAGCRPIMMFSWFCIYLVSLGEIAANPLIKGEHSKTFWLAMAIVIGTYLGI